MAERDRFLRIGEVADWTGFSVATFRHWRATGRGPRCAVIGKQLVYRESDVQAWLDAQFEAAS